jgi:hypothetical protein
MSLCYKHLTNAFFSFKFSLNEFIYVFAVLGLELGAWHWLYYLSPIPSPIFFFFSVLELEFKAFILSHSTSPFL